MKQFIFSIVSAGLFVLRQLFFPSRTTHVRFCFAAGELQKMEKIFLETQREILELGKPCAVSITLEPEKSRLLVSGKRADMERFLLRQGVRPEDIWTLI